MFGKSQKAAAAAARRTAWDAQFERARQAAAVSLAIYGEQTVAEALGREAEQYLAFVAIIREGGDESRVPSSMPEWLELGGQAR